VAVLTWTDDAGNWVLRSALTGLGARFQNWTPTTRPVGESATALGTGALTMFAFRTDYGASLDLEGLRGAARAEGHPTVTVLDACDRLIGRLVSGGSVNVWPENGVDANIVYVCTLAPGSEPRLTPTDRARREYALSVAVINTAGARMLYPY
jgi:hypothetical protein